MKQQVLNVSFGLSHSSSIECSGPTPGHHWINVGSPIVLAAHGEPKAVVLAWACLGLVWAGSIKSQQGPRRSMFAGTLLVLYVVFLKLLNCLPMCAVACHRLMISFTQDKTSHVWTGYLYAVLLLAVAFLQSVVLQQYFQRCFILGMKVRTALMAAVYKKVHLLSC